jgi:hypothetical protein
VGQEAIQLLRLRGDKSVERRETGGDALLLLYRRKPQGDGLHDVARQIALPTLDERREYESLLGGKVVI